MPEASEHSAVTPTPADAKAIEEALAAFGTVKSATHGRIRLQLQPDYRTPEAMASLKAQLAADERVKDVVINPRTGSVAVTYAAEHHGHSLLWAAIHEAELVGEAAFDLEPTEEEGEEAGEAGGTYGKLDQQVADLMYKVDSAIYRRTNGRIHVRGRVLPLAVAGLGVAQMAIYGISLEMLPGPLLIWLAHDIHVRFSREPPMQTQPELPESDQATAQSQPTTPLPGSAPAVAAA